MFFSGRPDCLSGKPGNVTEFETRKRNVREKSRHGKVSQKCSLLANTLNNNTIYLNHP